MFSCEIREIFKNTYFEEHLQMAAPKHLIFKEQPLVRWKHFNYTKQRTCSHNIDSCPEIRDNTKVVAFVWLLQNKHKIDDFSWWLSKIEPVIGALKYSSHNISFFFETKVFFWKTNFILMIKFASSGILEVTQPAITCSKSTIETLEQGVKYVQS